LYHLRTKITIDADPTSEIDLFAEWASTTLITSSPFKYLESLIRFVLITRLGEECSSGATTKDALSEIPATSDAR
jgi:hypothetical protein